jgi:hypothetical protein
MKLTWGLGTIGLRRGEFYADICLKPAFQLFVNDGIVKRWYSLPRMRLLKVEIIDAENARRIARRTMKPWTWLRDRTGHKWEAICYPFICEDGGVKIKVRHTSGVVMDKRCEWLRPWNFARRTGINANDPIRPKKETGWMS